MAMKTLELKRALDAAVSGSALSESWKRDTLRRMQDGRGRPAPRRRAAVAVALAVLSVGLTALAVGVLVQQYYRKVAEMDGRGALTRWNLADKAQFVHTMQACGFAVDESDLAKVADAALPDSEREAAADRIVDARYGPLIRESMQQWVDVPDTSLGLPPTAEIVFMERYLAEHPGGIATREDMLAYTDALGYYLRDEYLPAYAKAHPQDIPKPRTMDADAAADLLRGYMTEVLSWDGDAVARITPAVAWDEQYRVWTAEGELDRASVERSPHAVTEGAAVQQTGTGYRVRLMADEHGNFSAAGLDKAAFREQHRHDVAAVIAISGDQALRLAADAVRARFGLTDGDMHRLFTDAMYAGTGDRDGELRRFVFHTHYMMDTEPMYGATVNMATGQVAAAFSYRLDDRAPVWRLLDFAARTERDMGWYLRWEPAQKQALAEHIRDSGLMAGHAFWRNTAPSGTDIDAFVAEAFRTPGYPSLINAAVMANALLGPADALPEGDRAMLEHLWAAHDVRSEDGTAGLAPGGAEIDAVRAAAIVRAAVCRAWDMPEGALDAWQAVARRTQGGAPHRGLVYYRVYLTRPDSELDKPTFGGRDNVNYRVLLDGTVADTSVAPGWNSPAEDRAAWDSQR